MTTPRTGADSTSRLRPAPLAIVGGIAGILWLGVGALSWSAISAANLHGLEGAILPATVPPSVWMWPIVWTTLFALTAAIGVGFAYAALLRLTAPTGDTAGTAAPWRAWFLAVAVGAAMGLATDGLTMIGSFFTYGAVLWSSGMGAFAAAGAYWGLLYGWIPAIVEGRMRRRALAADTPAELAAAAPVGAPAYGPDAHRPLAATDAVSAPAMGPRPGVPTKTLAFAGVAVAVVIALVTIGVLGMREARVADAQDVAIAEGADPSRGALPDPLAEGVPVADRAEPTDAAQTAADPDRCTPEQAMLLFGEKDAATGHRVQSIRLMNFSNRPCTVEGYPDVAFGDQNEHALNVLIEHGHSFMADDPGVTRVEVPANGYAIAYLGWDAGVTADALVATSLHAAMTAGDERGSWPLESDIVEGSTISVTAWEPAVVPTS
ncbi:DUF4232 domain-containing protein [Agromyces sp. NPDC058110]|uniref:DUF4232 domain-containing protein n=1 Tax=Agromyces sp. NPDC058110 TaxID=3346345 RepID=UPI0036DAC4C3